jgi:hypothetical protein
LSFTSANDGANVTASIGELLGTYSRAAAGVNRLTLSSPVFHRAPVLIASPGSDATLGGYAVLGADPTYQVLDPKTVADDGVAEDAIIHSMCLGWLSDSTDIVRKQQIHTVYSQPRFIGMMITGSASPTMTVGAADATVAMTGATAGDYTITLNRPFNQVPVVVASRSVAAGGVQIGAVTRSTIQVLCGSAAGAAAHGSFNLFVMGSDSLVEQHDLRRAVKATHVGPELMEFHITVTGGTPTLTLGGDYGTVADTGTGVFTVTLTTPKARRLIPVCTASNRVFTSSEDTDSFIVNCGDQAGTAEDPTDVQGLILAYGNADQYYQG